MSSANVRSRPAVIGTSSRPEARHDDDRLDRGNRGNRRVRGLLHRDELAAPQRAVGGDERLRVAVVESHRDRIGAVAGEDGQEDRAELGDGHDRGDRLRDHREEHADRVALPDAPRREPVRDPVGEHAQLGVGERPRRALFALPDDGRTVAPVGAVGPLVDAVVGNVQLAAGEPGGPLDAGRGVEHLRVRRRPLDPDEPYEGVPEPLRVGDRPGAQLGEVGEPVLGHEATDVAPRR